MKSKYAYIAAALALISSASAMADGAQGVSEAPASSFRDKIAVTYFGVLYGPGFNGISQPDLYTGAPNQCGQMILENLFFAIYNITPDLTIAPVLHFYLNTAAGGTTPGATLAGAQNAATGKAYGAAGGTFVLDDPFVELSHAHLYQNGGFNLVGQFRVYAPISSSMNNQFGAIRTNQIVSYDVPGTKLSLGSYSFVKAIGYTNGGTGNDVIIHVAPNATYQFHPKVAATLWVDAIELAHKVGTTGMTFVNSDMDIEPG
ncbi:MAG: hypothetical protein ACXWPM_13150, partial [Bdellovibrionota bacterium]